MPSKTIAATYQSLLYQYLQADTEPAREAVLKSVNDLAHSLVPQQVPKSELMALHSRAMVECWSGSTDQAVWHRLANGEAMSVMLALLIPEQMEELRRAERSRKAEHARLAAVFEQTDDLVLMFDAEGRIEYVNPAFTRTTGWNLPAAQARPDLVWSEALPLTSTLHIETEQCRLDQTRFAASWSVSPIRNEDGQLLNHVCIGRDISQQRQIDEALRQNDRLRAVATLAAGIAHDFNNVLGSIQGLTELCQLTADPGSPMLRNLDGIHRASGHAADLVRQLLGFAREMPPQKIKLDVSSWLTRLEPLLAASLPKNVRLQLDLEPDLTVSADPGQLEQVLLNLIKNAGYAMRHVSGVVDVVIDGWRDAENSAWARIRVIDQGEGIAPEILPTIFDPFFTTKPVDEGTGLGLSTAYGIMRRHQGELKAESTAGQSTVFTVLLPLTASPSSTAASIEPSDQVPVASWYDVDHQDCILAVSGDWDRHARSNGGSSTIASRVVGRPLRSFIAGEKTQRSVLELIHLVRLTGVPQRTVYSCNTPTLLRSIEMELMPQRDGIIRLEHRLISEQPRAHAAAARTS